MLLARGLINFLAKSDTANTDPLNALYMVFLIWIFCAWPFSSNLCFITKGCISWEAFYKKESFFTSLCIFISHQRHFILIREDFAWKAPDFNFIFISMSLPLPLDFWFIIKRYELGAASWKRCIGQVIGKGKEFSCFPRVPLSWNISMSFNFDFSLCTSINVCRQFNLLTFIISRGTQLSFSLICFLKSFS